ncbi:hypothetical protein [Methanoculleus receptaculi]|uniref:Uncharacterized protein n=1 Tax=Methanoculleus receptaculi TaxID=394967 RepID=A0AAX4FVT2_9EURY|nr:hypothetical protein [Methanoculleus receptaculi]WOX58058.1 hypothetical protein R6Y96_02050 [Methanoculleus receptaculi]
MPGFGETLQEQISHGIRIAADHLPALERHIILQDTHPPGATAASSRPLPGEDGHDRCHRTVNDEEHEEEGKYRTQEVRSPKAKQPGFLTLDEMLLMLAEVNKFLKKQNRTAVGNTTLAFLCK